MIKKNISEIILFLLLILVVSISCKDKKLYPDLDHIQIDLKVVPFYQEINKVDTQNVLSSIQLLQDKYGQFLKAYNQKIINLGKVEDKDYSQRLTSFINYEANKDIIKKAKEVFPNHDVFTRELEKGFKYYKYYFPEARIPDVYLMISGFSQSIAVDNDWVGLSIEKYLGSDCEFYEWLNIAKYLRKGMTKEKMAPDVLRAIALTNYRYDDQVDDVINHMVYKGKIRYFMHRMFPELQDTLLFDYSATQMEWCNTNEANMWASMVEWKHVFSNDRMLIRKYTEDAPFTANFGNNSAPRGGEFLGYKIVEAYMNKNDQMSLKELMEEPDGRKILAGSNYRP
jgi:hypothetical protein